MAEMDEINVVSQTLPPPPKTQEKPFNFRLICIFKVFFCLLASPLLYQSRNEELILRMTTITKILVTGYMEILGRSIARHLNRQGFAVCGVCDIDQAKSTIEVAEKSGQPFGLVISDISRQNRNEISFINWLHTHHPEVSVLVVSGFGNGHLLNTLLRSDRDSFRNKPVLPQEIVGAILCIEKKKQARLGLEEIPLDTDETISLDC